MSETKTADEVKLSHIEAMGEELGTVYNKLWNELAWLFCKWDEYEELYGTKPSRIDLINKVAGHFFKVVGDALWEDCLMHISRLTDNSETKVRQEVKKNLSIKYLPQLIEDAEFKQQVSMLIEIAAKKSDFSRDWRNRRIAHKDLSLVLGKSKPLEPASRLKVKESLSAIADVLNAVSSHYKLGTTGFEYINSPKGALDLLYVLDDGLRVEEQRHKKVKNGLLTIEDIENPDL